MKLKVPHQVLPTTLRLWIMHNIRTGQAYHYTISSTRSGAMDQMADRHDKSGRRYFRRMGWVPRRITINVLVPATEWNQLVRNAPEADSPEDKRQRRRDQMAKDMEERYRTASNSSIIRPNY